VRISPQCHRAASKFGPIGAKSALVALGNGLRKYWELGHGEPLILIPGLAGGFELLGPLARALSRRYHVFALEPLNEGDPFLHRPPEALEELVLEQREFQQRMGLESPYLVGVSFGSVLALKLALKSPGAVRGVVLSGIGSHSESPAAAIVRRILERYCLPTDSPFVNQFFRLLFGQDEPVEELLEFVARRCWKTGQAAIAHRLSLLSRYDVRPELHRLRVPVLIIAGESDWIIRWETQADLASRLPKGQFVKLQKAGHLCFLTEAKQFARLVYRFFERLARDDESAEM
jgi:pimeloyl-ACP methyl ester carboxylesterase